jgi:arylsulfatase A-like enzyme
MNQQKSLILVTVDCLRADHAGFLGYRRPTTPFLDTLSAESFVLPTAITGGAPTYYSFPTILASRYPLALGRDQIGLAPGENCLSTVLKDAGYATAAFCAGNPYLSSRFGYDQGFDTFEDFLGEEISAVVDSAPLPTDSNWKTRFNRKLDAVTHRLGPIGALYDELYFQYCQHLATPSTTSLDQLRRFPSADVLVNKGLDWIRSTGDSPFFLWLHFMDPHSPYFPQPGALEAMGDGNLTAARARYLNSFWNRSDLGPGRLSRHRDEVIRLYDAGIRWVDAQLARLVTHLQNLNRWEKCLFALTADHGEEFLDHNGRYHPPNHLTEELIHVPLMIRVPGTQPKHRPDASFSHVHLAPTLLEAAGLQPPGSFQGHSLWLKLREGQPWDSPAVAESVSGCTNPFLAKNRVGARVLVIREAHYKLVLDFASRTEALYDLNSDPGEKSPLPNNTAKQIRRRLLEIARDHLHSSNVQHLIEARLRSRLRDLQVEWRHPHQRSVSLRSLGGNQLSAE